MVKVQCCIEYCVLWSVLLAASNAVVAFQVHPSSSSSSSCPRDVNRHRTRACTARSTVLRHSKSTPDPANPDGDIPSMDWLTNSLAKKGEEAGSDGKDDDAPMTVQDMTKNPFVEEFSQDDGGLGDVPIPSSGVSVSDEMAKAFEDRFYTELVEIQKGMEKGVRVAQIVTTATAGSFEPVRYIVGLSKVAEEDDRDKETAEGDTDITQANDFVMVDVPPFSKQLVQDIQKYMGKGGKLKSILVTSRDCIHYNEAPGVFAVRRADLRQWELAFPDTAIAAYRLDIPRDCRDSVTQRLDGYGPFALDESDPQNVTFIETGRPLTYEEWDHDVSEDIFEGKQIPPDDAEASGIVRDEDGDVIVDVTRGDDDDLYSPAAIRANEEGKRVLAVYTPGRSYGSVSYVFPEIQLCASGFTIPVEDSRNEENMGLESAGPALDCRGYITTSRAGISRQMESARNLIDNYVDRFQVLLPSRGDPFYLDGNAKERQQVLLDVVAQYEKIGKIYEQLGITRDDGDDF